MKRLITSIITLAVTAVYVSAQFFVEGSMNVSYYSYKSSFNGNTSPSSPTLSFGLSPRAGFWLNDKIAAGAEIFFDMSTRKFRTIDPDNPEQEIKITSLRPHWGFSVFSRYKFWGTDKLSLFAQGSIGYSAHVTKEKTAMYARKTHSVSSFSINVTPLISYELNDKISLMATCRFFRLGFRTLKAKDEINGSKHSETGFNFSAQSIENLNIGIMYNF